MDPPPLNLEQKLANDLLTAFRNTWVNEFKKAGGSQVTFARISVVALSQLAAMVGVDVGMNTEQFTNVCKANFDEAHKRAPKFG